MPTHMEQRHFRGERGAFHIDCHDCGVDAHVVRWDQFRGENEPTNCPYCGSDDIWYADESLR